MEKIWNKSDPRNHFNNGQIIIAIPEGGSFKFVKAWVETKNSYSILLDDKNIRCYAGEDEWDKDWLWTFVPSEFNIETNPKKWWED